MPLTLRQVEDVCMCSDGANQCRYLAEDDKSKFYCIKRTAEKTDIDNEVALFKKKAKAQGQNPSHFSIPIGDNCTGYTFFRYKMQGYDLP